MPFEGTVTLAKSSKSPADLQKVLDTLEALRTNTETFSIVTPLREYKNLNLLSYEYKFEENGATSQLIVDLALIEVREVESSYSDVVVSSGAVRLLPAMPKILVTRQRRTRAARTPKTVTTS